MAPDEDTHATAGAASGDHEDSGALGLTGKLLMGRYRVESRLGQGGMAAGLPREGRAPEAAPWW